MCFRVEPKNSLTMKNFSLISVFLFTVNLVYAQEWNQLSTPSDEDLTTVFFLDENTGFVGTKDPEIWTTSDGGQNWETMTPGALSSSGTEWIQDIFFVDDNHGWIAAYSGGATSFPGAAILRTTDGGESWTTPIDNDSTNINSVFFLETNTGWAVGQGGLIMHSTDGGVNWNIQQSATQEYDLHDVYFKDANNGWAVGGEDNFTGTQEGYIYRTTDGGETWTLQFTDDDFGNNIIEKLAFPDDQNGWGDGVRTSDGGDTWTTEDAVIFDAVDFANSDWGWYANFSEIKRKSQEDDTWITEVPFGEFESGFHDLHAVDQNVVYAVGDDGLILKRGESSSLDEIGLVSDFKAYPNPTVESLIISFSLKKSHDVSLELFDSGGKQIATIAEGSHGAGEHRYNLAGKEFGDLSGLVMMRLTADGKSLTKRIVIE